jgi:hypothetical protein
MPPTHGKRLWKSAGTTVVQQKAFEKGTQDGEQEKAFSAVRIAVLVPKELTEVVKSATSGHQVHFLFVCLVAFILAVSVPCVLQK